MAATYTVGHASVGIDGAGIVKSDFLLDRDGWTFTHPVRVRNGELRAEGCVSPRARALLAARADQAETLLRAVRAEIEPHIPDDYALANLYWVGGQMVAYFEYEGEIESDDGFDDGEDDERETERYSAVLVHLDGTRRLDSSSDELPELPEEIEAILSRSVGIFAALLPPKGAVI